MPSSIPSRASLRAGLVVLCALLVAAPPVRAEPSAQDHAKVLFEEAQEAYDRGDFKTARASFIAAHQTWPRPAFLFNRAQCERRLGDRRQAALYYRQYLALEPSGPGADNARALLAEVESEQVLQERGARRSAVQTAAVAQRREDVVPFYRTWWFITGASVLVGAAVGVTVWAAATPPGANGSRPATLGQVTAR